LHALFAVNTVSSGLEISIEIKVKKMKKGVDNQEALCRIRASLEGTATDIKHRSLKISQAIRVGAD